MVTQSLELLTDKQQTGTRLESLITAFTIAVSFHGNNANHPPGFYNTVYKDVRDGPNFLHDMLAYMFRVAEGIAEDNKYGDKEIDDIYNWREVPVLGFNSAKFDLNLILSELQCNEWRILPAGLMVGGVATFKKIKVEHRETKIVLSFLDLRNFLAGGSLDDNVKNFGDGKVSKGTIPYEAIRADNFMEYLNTPGFYPQADYHSELKKTDISDDDYTKQQQEWDALEQQKHQRGLFGKLRSNEPLTRWEHLEYYNRNDVNIMIPVFNNLINFAFEDKVDMLQFFSLASVAVTKRYAALYEDFDPNADYNGGDALSKPYYFSKAKCRGMVYRYLKQDQAANADGAKRNAADNVNADDFDKLNAMFTGMEKNVEEAKKPRYNQGECHICHKRFSNVLTPTLDRIDNSVGHSYDNVLPCCVLCNSSRGNQSIEDARFKIQLHKYALLNNLPMTIDDERVYHLLRNGITGGISNVLHKKTIAGKTQINKLRMENGKVYSQMTSDVVSHLMAADANSLYPSSFSSLEHELNPYTNHKMYMPARVLTFLDARVDVKVPKYLGEMSVSDYRDREKKQMMRYIDGETEAGTLFVASVKGSIRATEEERINGVQTEHGLLTGRAADEYYINKCINFPPIFRNTDITINEQTLGSITMGQIVKLDGGKTKKKPDVVRKLTQLIDTQGRFISFNNYYLWFLIDTCHFVVEDVEQMAVFTRTDCFKPWVEKMKDQRVEYMKAGNKGGEKYCKLIMNGSYGFDGLNEAKYAKTKLVDMSGAVKAISRQDFSGMRQINGNLFIVSYKPPTYKCKTCLHCAYFTLDNAKFWYNNVLYNHIYKFIDQERAMVVYVDTDCYTFAIAGDLNKGLNQGFSEIIKDTVYYEEHKYDVFPDPSKGKEDEKKILGLAVENIGDRMFASAPKSYILHKVKRGKDGEYERDGGGGFKMEFKIGMKGANTKRNASTKDADYLDNDDMNVEDDEEGNEKGVEDLNSEINETSFKNNVEKGKPIYAENMIFHPKKISHGGVYVMAKERIRKVAVSGINTKSITMENYVCAPFIHGLTSADYITKQYGPTISEVFD